MSNRGRKNGYKTPKRAEMGEEKWALYQKERKRIKRERWYSKEENRQKNIKRVSGWRVKRKEELMEYKGGKCVACGYSKKVPSAYDFHHLDPKEKEFSISKARFLGMEELKKEVDKCILVCKNCHAEIHHELRGGYSRGSLRSC